jgi:hypothetical protein
VVQPPGFGGEYINDVNEEDITAERFGEFPLRPAWFISSEGFLVQLAEAPGHLWVVIDA